MGSWGLITGIFFALFLRLGFWGFLLGLFVGEWLRVFFARSMQTRSAGHQDLFMTITFEVLGHLSKSKGVVTENDIQIAYKVMDQFRLGTAARRKAQEAFSRGKAADYPLQARLRLLYNGYRFQRNVLRVFVEFQIVMALSGQELHPNSRKILMIIARELHFSPQQMEHVIQMMTGGAQFGDRGQQSGYQHSRSAPSRPSLADAYRALGVKSSDDAMTIKRAYRKLMNANHPDKLAAKGLPPEMVDVAKKRTQEIQAAYDLIKQHLGFK